MGVSSNETFLLLMPNKDIYPIVGSAFSVSQNSKLSLSSNKGAYVISKTGSVRIIKNVTRKNIYGRSLKEKFINLLFGLYEIEVDLLAIDMPFNEIKMLIKSYLKVDMNSDDPTFMHGNKEQCEQLINKIDCLPLTGAIFDLLNFPNEEDCLDML